MNIAVTEIRRAKARFGLLTGAVALLVFLVLLLTTLSNALVTALTGALEGLDADGIVYSASARDNLQASRLDPALPGAIAGIDGVEQAGGIATFTATTELDGAMADIQVFGFTADAPGMPTALTDGRLPTGAGETAVDGGGLSVGDRIVIGTSELTVVGTLRAAQFNALPTAYVEMRAYPDLISAVYPGLPYVPINAVAFTTADGADAAAVTAAIAANVPDTKAYTLAAAVAAIPGIGSIQQSFGILQGLTFVIAVVVIGFFFLILTVQKLRALTVLRAIGASTGRLAGELLLQVVIVVVSASAIAALLTIGAVAAFSTGIPVSVSPTLFVTAIAGVVVFALVAALFSVRRIARVDPTTATGVR